MKVEVVTNSGVKKKTRKNFPQITKKKKGKGERKKVSRGRVNKLNIIPMPSKNSKIFSHECERKCFPFFFCYNSMTYSDNSTN